MKKLTIAIFSLLMLSACASTPNTQAGASAEQEPQISQRQKHCRHGWDDLTRRCTNDRNSAW